MSSNNVIISSRMNNMGCFPSKTATSSQAAKDFQNNIKMMQNTEETVVQAYVRLDNTINEMEKNSPAPRLAGLVPLLQISQEEIMKYEEDSIRNLQEDQNDDPLTQVLSDLKLSQSPHLASEHEEFVANINRQAINKIIKALMEAKFEELKKTKLKLEEDVEKLQLTYKEQDILLEKVLGNQYGSVDERSLEAALSRTRALRDTLAVGARIWKNAGEAALRAHTLASSALLSWQLTSQTKDVSERVRLGIEARNGITAGAQEVRAAQNALSDAPFPHCTARQLQALSLTLDYMFTDMYSNERYQHTTRVFSGFSERTLSLVSWITNILNTSLEKDLSEVEKDLNGISDQLRSVRVNLIVEKGYGDVRYKPPQEINF